MLGVRTPDLHRLYRRIIITLRIIKALLGKKRTHETVTVRGNAEFIDSTIKAVELLKEQVPDAYELVLKHIGDIVSGKPSGVFPDMLWLVAHVCDNRPVLQRRISNRVCWGSGARGIPL